MQLETIQQAVNCGIPLQHSCSGMPQTMLGYVEEVEREAEQVEGDTSANLANSALDQPPPEKL